VYYTKGEKDDEKQTATVITATLALTIAITLIALPAASAHTPPWNFPSYAYIVASPNPGGCGSSHEHRDVD